MALKYKHHSKSVIEVFQDSEPVGFMVRKRRLFRKSKWYLFSSRTAVTLDVAEGPSYDALYYLIDRKRTITKAANGGEHD